MDGDMYSIDPLDRYIDDSVALFSPFSFFVAADGLPSLFCTSGWDQGGRWASGVHGCTLRVGAGCPMGSGPAGIRPERFAPPKCAFLLKVFPLVRLILI